MYIRLYYVIAILLLSIASSCSEQQPVLIADTPTIETAVVETPAADTAMVATADDESDEYRENLHYSRIEPAQDTQSGKDRIEVVEMFFYACPHCYKLEPTIEQWLKNKADDVDFKRVPAIIGPTWAEQAKAFYIAEELGIADKVRKNLFDSIHKDGKQYYNQYTLMTFFTEQGVDANRFLELYESPQISEKTSDARVKTVRYGIRGVPAIIVNGKYYTATYFTRDHNEMLKVVDFLIEKERKEQKAASKSK